MEGLKPTPASWKAEHLATTLRAAMRFVFPRATVSQLDPEDAASRWHSLNPTSDTRACARWTDTPAQGHFEVLIHTARCRYAYTSGFEVEPSETPDDLDIRLIKILTRVVASDHDLIRDEFADREAADVLERSLVGRAIARASTFSAGSLLSWLSVVEAAQSLTCEGLPFAGTLLFSKQSQWIHEPAGTPFVLFPTPINFRRALLNDKWLRSVLLNPHVAAVGMGRRGALHGLMTFDDVAPGLSGSSLIAPQTDLANIAAILRPATMAFFNTPAGDLHVLTSNGYAFTKSQGQWRYNNYQRFGALMGAHLPPNIAAPLVRLALDLSYRRSGALLVIIAESLLDELVLDRRQTDRANRDLREVSKTLSFSRREHRELMLAAAAVDGATMIAPDGRVLDVACIIATPSATRLGALGIQRPQRFPGARATAAWNASILGVAINISEDGPITVYVGGRVVSSVGAA